jgi:hypothetical protein
MKLMLFIWLDMKKMFYMLLMVWLVMKIDEY